MIFGASRSDIAKYVLLPQIWPRIRALFGKGFEMVPYMLALVYQCVRLLPPSHPYADPRNIGRFTLRNVVAEAANHLVFRLGNIDQIVLFVAVLAGIVLAIVQFFLLGLALFVQPALAAMPTNFSEFFLSADPQDLSYMMLDLVFGVEGVFNSCVTSSSCVDMDGRPLLPDPAVGGLSVFHQSAWPYPIHAGLHELFRMYNLALLIVGMIIALYFMFTVVAETAQTGTAFGKRFNKVWAPLRIVVAFGLLVPIGHLNTAQYIVLYTAKFGTGFASKGWYLFNERLGYNYKAGMGDLVGKPQIPEVGALLQFMFTARTCYETDFIMNKRTSKIKPYAVKGGGILSPGDKRELSTYEDLSDFMAGQNVATIRFGVFDDKAYGTYKGFVAPLCGELNFILTDSRPHPEQEVGTKGLQKAYFDLMMHLWNTEWGAPGSGSGKPWNHACRQIGKCEQANKKDLPELTEAEITSATNNASTLVNTAVEAAVTAQNTSGRFDLAGGANEQIIKKGWPAAAIWYNRIAEMNGTLSTAAFRVPMPHKYPQAMEFVRAKKMQYDEDVPAIDKYKPQLSDGTPVKHPDIDYAEAIKAMHSAYVKWQANGVAGSGHTDVTGNIVIDIINSMFGTSGLYSMRENTNVHPLAQLSALGKSLVDAAINNIGYAAAGSLGGGLASAISKFPGLAAKMVSDLLITFSMIALTAGFILFYVVPFLPFIYFFFAFGGWIKAVFEAMVGAPLWALAHIRIDGEGLPGRAAMGGYFLLLEIFLRPLLTIFGFIASIIIFAAMVETLNEIFNLVTSNVSGFDVKGEGKAATASQIEYYRGPVDEFFYTIVYAVIVYMLGLSSFKLIDQIPANILRWMGQSVAPFGTMGGEDPAGEMLQNANIGLQQGLPKMGDGMQKIGGMVSNLGGSIAGKQ